MTAARPIPRRPAGPVLHTVRDFLARTFVEPVRGGRLRAIAWPVGLRPIVLVALVAEAVGIVLVLLAGPLREAFELTTPGGPDPVLFPRALLWIITALLGLALSLAAAGALHAPAWLRWVLTSFVSIVLVVMTASDTSGWQPGRILSIAAATGVLVFAAIRGGRRRDFAWWEFLVVLVLTWGSMLVTLGAVTESSRSFGVDAGILTVSFAISMLSQLAVPAAIAAGSAVAELTVSTATWAVAAIRDNLGRTALIVALVILLAWRSLDVGIMISTNLGDPSGLLADTLWAVVFLALVGAAWGAIAHLRPVAESPTTAGLLDRMGRITLPIAALSVITVLIIGSALVIQMLLFSFEAPAEIVGAIGAFTTLFSGYVVIDGLRIALGVAVVIAAALLARRGTAVLPELLASVGVSFGIFGVADLAGVGMSGVADALAIVGSVAAGAILLALLVRRRLTTTRVAALAAALAMSAMFAHRDMLSDPLAALLGAGALAVVLIGLIWGQLTGYQTANADSPTYPRPTRVLLALAGNVFAIAMIAYVTLARDDTAGFNAGDMAWVGSIGFGNALIAGALFIALGAAIRDRPVE